MTSSSSSFTSSNSNLNREDSFINLDIFMGEKVETLSTKSQMTDQDINAIKKKFDEFSFEIKQLKNQLKEEKKMANEDRIKNAELASELKKLKEVKAYFVKVPNKWTNIYSKCCDDNCVNDDTLNTTCSNEWGFIQITSDTNIKYNCKPNKTNREVIIAADESFEKPSLSKCCLNCATYPLYYFEIKLKIEKSKHLIIEIGLCDFDEHWDCIYLCLTGGYISYYDDTHKKDKFINLSSSFSFNNEDIIGCGVVYPNINNKLPYIFFTKNGELIGKAIEMKGNIQDLWPSAILKCCSIETNFGEDLNSKPFKYDISNHLVIEEFYKEEDFTDE